MQDVTATSSSSGGYPQLLEIEIDISDFSSKWENCDLISTYVSKMVSSNRTDSLLFANLYSSALNELLETAFRNHAGSGKLVCCVRRSGTRDRIELTLPYSTDLFTFYSDAIAHTKAEDADEIYLRTLFSNAGFDVCLGLLELAIDYEATLSVEAQEEKTIRLTADLELEEPAQ